MGEGNRELIVTEYVMEFLLLKTISLCVYYFWLRQVFRAFHGPALAVVSRGHAVIARHAELTAAASHCTAQALGLQ